MSLNGLDAQDINDAYQAAQVEAGGWFLLRYVSRDSVDLLSRGKNGVHEARNAIAKYEEQSPLYGLIIYRRRKVLIKFIPEGTSRLLQARTAVHFQDILERYQPYETLLEITHADGLNDTSLASSFPLHTASPATSSNRLHEISEDGEDTGNAPKRPRATNNSGQVFGTRQYKLERRADQLMNPLSRPTPSIYVSSEPSSLTASPPAASPPAASTKPAAATKPSISQFLVREDSGGRSISSITSPAPPQHSDHAGSRGVSENSVTKEIEPSPKPEVPVKDEVAAKPLPPQPVSRDSSHSIESAAAPTRTTAIQTSHSEPLASTMPESSSERVQTATSVTPAAAPDSARVDVASEFTSAFSAERPRPSYDEPFDFSYLDPKPKVKLAPRLVTAPEKTNRSHVSSISALPAAFRPAVQKHEQARPKSQGPGTSLSQTQMLLAFPPPPIPDQPEYSPRPVSRGSVKSTTSQKSTAMTPDKLRLMKALELRKRQLRKSNPHLNAAPVASNAPELPKTAPEPSADSVESITARRKALGPIATSNTHVLNRKPDSGIEMNYDQHAQKNSTEPQEDHEEKLHPVAASGKAEALSEEVTNAQPKPEVSSTSSARQLPTTGKEPLKKLEISLTSPPPPTDATDSLMAKPRPSFTAARNNSSTDSPTLERAIQDAAFPVPPSSLHVRVPAIVTTASSRPSSSDGKSERPSTATVEAKTLGQLQDGDTLDLPAASSSPRSAGSDLAKRRRGIVVEPVNTGADRSTMSDTETSDDEFLEELKTATLHQAKPITVSKSPSPGAQVFQRRPSNQSVITITKQSPTDSPQKVSVEPARATHRSQGTSPEPAHPPVVRERSGSSDSVRSFQAVRSSLRDTSDPSANLHRQVSDGISRRIAALADATTPLDISPNASRVGLRSGTPEADRSSLLASDRRVSTRSQPSHTNSYQVRRLNGDRTSAYSSSNNSQQPDATPVWSTSQDVSGKRESVSVKARIVRPQSNSSMQPQADESTVREPATLQESRIEINHSRGTTNPISPPVARAVHSPLETSNPRSNSASSATASTAVTGGRESTESRLLQSVRRRSYGRNKNLPPPPPVTGIDDVPSINPAFSAPPSSVGVSYFDDSPATTPAAPSRTSRFFRRMSNMGTAATKRRSIAASSVGSATSPAETRTMQGMTDRDRSDMPPAVVVGDLNVQFPDTLLWKRRALSLTDTGHLLLSAASSEHSRASMPPKRYHLQEFKAPYTPDLDRQEMPWSIWLEFLGFEGGVLQVACEDAMGQRQVLRLLGGHWKSWAG